MRIPFLFRLLGSLVALSAASALFSAPRQMENLGRGVVAVHQPDGKVFVSWRLLGNDPAGVAFNLYRTTAPAEGGPAERGPFSGRTDTGVGPVKLNTEPITDVTWWLDAGADLSRKTEYFVRPVVARQEGEPGKSFAFAAGAPPLPYLSIPLEPPPGGTSPDGVAYTYTANDCSVGDLDGDGEYELVLKWDPTNSHDNAHAGFTGNVYLDAYKLDGTRLWRIDLGRNIRAGAHYTQFMVYDLDGDGRAEVACKTADGTIDGTGRVIGDPKADWRETGDTTAATTDSTGTQTNAAGQRVSRLQGRILRGPEYFTVFAGATGKALATVDYVPPRGEVAKWGDAYGNRCDRFLACVAYLDGERPSVVMCRGYYTRAVLAAWDWRDGKLTQRWVFDSDDGTPGNERYRGQGDHQLSVADVDGDGRDEIIYGACVIDDNGKGLYSTGRKHGDALHCSDLDPARPGLEVFQVHEEPSECSGGDFRDAKTGERLWGLPSTKDAGRGVSANIDPRYPGAECWSAPSDGLYTCKGEKLSDAKPRSCNFLVWWDGDLLRELLDQNFIAKWNWETGRADLLLIAHECSANNGTKATPALSADLFGDWREEVIWRTRDGKELRIYTTTIPTKHRLVTLMHDPQYRLAIAWQNVAYNQPPHPSFYLDESAPLPPRPDIVVVPVK